MEKEREKGGEGEEEAGKMVGDVKSKKLKQMLEGVKSKG